jgi:hypothetical protein
MAIGNNQVTYICIVKFTRKRYREGAEKIFGK